jgi:hypothetical protein
MTHIKRNLWRSASAEIPPQVSPVVGAAPPAACDCPARCRRYRYGFWLGAAVLPLAAGFSVPASGAVLVGAVLVGAGELLVPPPPKGFFQPPQELQADSESTSMPARNTFRCVRFMINSSVVGVLQCVRDDAVPLQ